VGFFRDCLRHTKGEWAGQPFRVLPWQRALIDDLFGTLLPDGRRQYRRVYCEIPKKQGKSAFAAGIALYLLLGENEPEAEIYSAAVDREQARIVFAQARRMVETSPELARHVEVFSNALVRTATGGSYRVLSADVPTKHGINAHGVIFDELHALPNRELWDVLQGATAARRQPVTLAITTAGFDRESIGWEEHDRAQRILAGTVEAPDELAVIYAAGPDDDWTDPAVWAKANPSLGVTVRPEFLEAECRRAQLSPAYENTFRRYHLNQWTEQVSRWLPLDAWATCSAAVDDADLEGAPCYAGLDLGQTEDFSALVLVFVLPDGRWATRTRYWLPAKALERYPHRPYAVWQRQNRLTVHEGDTTTFDAVGADVLEECQRYGVRELAYDKRFATQIAQRLTGAGIVAVDTPQGFQLNEPLRKLLELVLAGKLAHGADPVLAWMAGNMVVRTGTRGEIRPAKDAAKDKIDGIVALAMAIDRAIRSDSQPPEESAYADHGLVTV
jgi:phage terminase large subunit-like protein